MISNESDSLESVKKHLAKSFEVNEKIYPYGLIGMESQREN